MSLPTVGSFFSGYEAGTCKRLCVESRHSWLIPCWACFLKIKKCQHCHHYERLLIERVLLGTNFYWQSYWLWISDSITIFNRKTIVDLLLQHPMNLLHRPTKRWSIEWCTRTVNAFKVNLVDIFLPIISKHAPSESESETSFSGFVSRWEILGNSGIVCHVYLDCTLTCWSGHFQILLSFSYSKLCWIWMYSCDQILPLSFQRFIRPSCPKKKQKNEGGGTNKPRRTILKTEWS